MDKSTIKSPGVEKRLLTDTFDLLLAITNSQSKFKTFLHPYPCIVSFSIVTLETTAQTIESRAKEQKRPGTTESKDTGVENNDQRKGGWRYLMVKVPAAYNPLPCNEDF